ncbi:hypothetical protein CEW92_17180 [Bacillaceae bacterium SAS-127]|nr:hypothetical protein CEW92_17180 [Bacillaceae bacterium SAS-127]
MELDIPKCGKRCSVTYELERPARDKGNTKNASESMLTYRKEDRGSSLVTSACSWTSRNADTWKILIVK